MYSRIHGSYQAHKLTLAGVDEEAFNRSLASARVDMNPHQVDAALFALKSPLAKGVLLADEVGLGKTIEAGLVLSQKWAEHKRRIILIVPASLRKQWQQELAEKFGLRSTIIAAATYKQLQKDGHTRPFEGVDGIIIASYEFAARKADELKIIRWDMVVFDEAHRLRNVYKKGGSQRAKDLKAALKDHFKVLLTATPLQNSLMELYGIVSIVDEDHFGGEHAFKAQYAGARASETSLEVLKERLQPVCHRTLRKQVQEAGHISFTRRNAQTFSFDPSHSEEMLYDQLSGFLQRTDTVSYGDKANQLVVLQVRKIMGSSSFAVARYLETLIARLRARKAAALSMTDDVEEMISIAEEADEDSDGEEEVAISPEVIAAEIAELEGYLELANSIAKNAKGEKLLEQLPNVLDQIEGKGGARKAVIFTESVRTQHYLRNLLEQHGYAGRIVLMNGSNSDDESRAIYAGWAERHKGTDKISGSKSADMKAAIVEAFKGDDKTILIATESGAEGINLQFCSLLINYDLPWNPQRVEQRIGRCHRYGQKIDVTVVNMLNLKNRTEARIHELLSEKFHLFQGVFGASDDVLGTLVSGLDFEKQVLRIVQESRSPEQIEFEFDALKSQIQDKIDEEVAAARNKVLGELDATVVQKLRHRGDELAKSIPEYKQRLLIVAHAALPDARFETPGGQRFEHDGKTYTTEWPIADEHDWQFFRVAEGLGADLVEAAKAQTGEATIGAITLRPDEYPYPGQVGAVKQLKGQSGIMRVFKATMPSAGALREELLFAILGPNGNPISAEVGDAMFQVPGAFDEKALEHIDEASLKALEHTQFAAFSDRVQNENMAWIDEEEARLDRYAKDIEIEIDAQIEEMDVEVKELQRQKRSPNLTMEEKVDVSRKIKRLENDIDDLKLSKFDRRKKVRAEVNAKLDDIADRLNQKPEMAELFTLAWAVE